MKTSVKKEEKSQIKLTVELDAEEVSKSVKAVEKVFLREAQIPGFRKGKVPMEVIRKEFGAQLKQETIQTLVRDYYSKAIEAEKVQEVTLVGVEEVDYNAEGGKFTAIVDVKPEFKLPTYKGLKVAFKDVKVDDKDVAEQIERLRTAYAKYEDAKEGEVIEDGDFVQIDYEGKIGRKAILDINPEAKFVAKGEGYWTQVEEGRFLPEILDALKGMKAGETKEKIKAKFDKNAAPEGLKGETATYKVTVKMFRKRVLPTDAEFAEKAKEESIEALTKKIRETMEKNAVEQESARRENEAVELLMKKVNFEVPESQMRRATESYLQEFAQRAQYSGLDADYFEKNRDKILKEAEDAATRQVRLWYVLEAIAKQEKIEGKDDEIGKKVIEFVLANAKK